MLRRASCRAHVGQFHGGLALDVGAGDHVDIGLLRDDPDHVFDGRLAELDADFLLQPLLERRLRRRLGSGLPQAADEARIDQAIQMAAGELQQSQAEIPDADGSQAGSLP